MGMISRGGVIGMITRDWGGDGHDQQRGGDRHDHEGLGGMGMISRGGVIGMITRDWGGWA